MVLTLKCIQSIQTKALLSKIQSLFSVQNFQFEKMVKVETEYNLKSVRIFELFDVLFRKLVIKWSKKTRRLCDYIVGDVV